MNQSRSGKPNPVLKGVELHFQQKVGSASFGAKVVPSFEWSGSELYELNYWIHLLEQSAQISYKIIK
jgi:hypothetical protein